MNTLTTRKIVLGMLLVLVLAFSVQGTADAEDLPLSKTSGDLQTESVGETFEIKFSVGIRRNTTAIRNSDGELIDDGALTAVATATPSTSPPGIRIDSSGYPINEINGKDYRLTAPINADTSGLGEVPPSPTGYTRSYTVHEKRPSPFSDYQTYSGVIFANSSRSAFSNRGYPLYYHIPASDENSDDDTSDTGEPARTTSQIKIQTDDFYTRRPVANRYHYNQEKINIQVAKVADDGTITFAAPAVTTMTFKLDAPVFQRDITEIAEVPVSFPDALPRSVTLICTPEPKANPVTGTYKVKISDATPVADTPWTTLPNPQAYIEFTLFVVESTAGQFVANSIEPIDEAVYYGGEEPLRLDNYFRFYETTVAGDGTRTTSGPVEAPDGVQLHYQVAEGPATVYVKTNTAKGSPVKSLLTSTEAQVFLNMNNGRSVVIASIAGQDPDTKGATIVFHYIGSRTGTGGTTSGTTGGTTGGTTPPPPILSVSPTSISGAPSSAHTLTITTPAPLAQISVNPSTTFRTAGGFASPAIATNIANTYTSTITLPSVAATYTATVNAGTAGRQITMTVGAGTTTPQGSTVRVSILGSGGPGTRATVSVTATDATGNPAANVVVTLSITAGGGTFLNGATTTAVTTNAAGTATAILTRGSTPGSNYYVTASAPGYTFQSALSAGERLTIAGTQPGTPGTATTTTRGPAADLDAYDGNQQLGSLNSPLPEPFVVEVVDANDNPVEDARVRFRTTIGSGRFSPRTPRTDEEGLAETTFTPTSTGRIRIVATVAGVTGSAAFTVQGGEPADALVKVSGDNQSGTPGNALANPFVVEVQDEDGEPLTGHSVTFSVTAGGGSLSATSATTNANGRAQTTLTLGSAPGVNSVQASVSGVDSVTFSTSIDAKILVAAANRPVMYWIAGGGLYSLSGAKEAKIAESANGVAVGGGKIYWTSQVNASSGAINSANLDGTGATTLTTILAVPMGIAVDTAGSKLYWTNSRGRIQSANLNGSSIKNVLLDRSDPTDIVVSNGFIYWTEGGNSVRRVNMSGQVKIAIDVAVNLNTVGGLAVGGGKVYWTEMTSASAGTVNGANLNGTNFAALATLLSAPMGISVDTAGSKLYWTNARGRVQSANLDGSGIKNVVEGLISPSKLAIGGANTETTTVKAATPAKKDNAKYDVNGDGTVDNTDASLVSAGFDTGNAKYDVNGDGKVSFLDLLLVFDNRDDDAAAAPAIVGMKLNAVQIDRIEEQIDLLIATNDRSPAALRTLVYMQQLLVTARPEKTQLFANYPNPFNPETWLPYELATDTHVKITIYNTQGVVIRTLQFGHQSAGYYTDRDRAAYWDGRNALGEQVASGLYFYQLETDTMSSMRKMVILK